MTFEHQFQINQKIFVKVIRGYPPWPGKICDIFLNRGKIQYLVYLYGFNLCTKTEADKVEDYGKYVHKNVNRLSVQLFFAKAYEDMLNDRTDISQKILSDKNDLASYTSNIGNTSKFAENLVANELLSENEGLQLNLEKKLSQFTYSAINKFSDIDLPNFSVYKKANNVTDKYSSTRQNKYSSILNTEIKLLKCDYRIKSCLMLSRAKCEDCLKIMNDMLKLKLNTTIIKKHPQIVETILNLRKYVGNMKKWKLSHDNKRIFVKNAAKIRIKASKIYNSIKKLFDIPRGNSFMEVYVKELQTFWKKNVN